ncbi:hypothetical protein D3C81_1876300 [compost metagenome]
MVGADDLVAIADIGAVAEEQRAVAGHALVVPVRVAGHHLHMLGAQALGDFQRLFVAVAQVDLAEVAPGDAGDRCCIQT